MMSNLRQESELELELQGEGRGTGICKDKRKDGV